jgi:hypothetical protein
MKSKTFIRFIAVFLIMLFVSAAVYKLLTFGTFRSQLNKSSFIIGYAGLVAPLVPALEILVAVLLYRPASRLAGLFCSFFLVSFYTIYLLGMLSMGHEMSCNCGELWQRLSLGQHLLFNIAVVVMICIGVILSGKIKYETAGMAG